MKVQTALDLAARILDALAAEPARLSGFMIATGLGPDDLRAGLTPSGTPEQGLALAILDYLMADEPLLMATCHDLTLTPDTPARAQLALGGGPGPHWT
jgi:hypothetical protein